MAGLRPSAGGTGFTLLIAKHFRVILPEKGPLIASGPFSGGIIDLCVGSKLMSYCFTITMTSRRHTIECVQGHCHYATAFRGQ